MSVFLYIYLQELTDHLLPRWGDPYLGIVQFIQQQKIFRLDLVEFGFPIWGFTEKEERRMKKNKGFSQNLNWQNVSISFILRRSGTPSYPWEVWINYVLFSRYISPFLVLCSNQNKFNLILSSWISDQIKWELGLKVT